MLKTLGLTIVAVFAFSALTASAASATNADFAADGYPAHVTANGKGTQTFVVGATTLTCIEKEGVPPVTGTATLIAESSSLTVGEIKWHNCHATVLKIPVTVDQNGCEFTFTSGETTSPGTSKGTVHIINCDDATKGITVTIGAEGKSCHIDVPEQTPNSGAVTYHNVETLNGVEDVTATVEDVNVDVDTTGGTACPESKGTNDPVAATATFNGAATATGENEDEEPTDVTITDTE